MTRSIGSQFLFSKPKTWLYKSSKARGEGSLGRGSADIMTRTPAQILGLFCHQPSSCTPLSILGSSCSLSVHTLLLICFPYFHLFRPLGFLRTTKDPLPPTPPFPRLPRLPRLPPNPIPPTPPLAISPSSV